MEETSLLTLVEMTTGLALAATIAGLLAGFLGVGGGVVLVPVLLLLFSLGGVPEAISMHMAIATSLASITFTSITSIRAHNRNSAIDFQLLKRWAPAMALGALLGGLSARSLDPSSLKGVFSVLALVLAVNFVVKKPVTVANKLPKSRLLDLTISGSIGVLSCLMGTGGGTISVPILNAFKYPIKKAIGTAACFGLAISIPGTLAFATTTIQGAAPPPWSLGYVSVVPVAVIIPFSMMTAPIGARLVNHVDARLIKNWFAAFLFLTSIQLGVAALSS